MEIVKPETVGEAIDNLQEFLECDLYSKLRPEIEIKGETFIREDYIRNEKEFYKYLDAHFNILREQLNELGVEC